MSFFEVIDAGAGGDTFEYLFHIAKIGLQILDHIEPAGFDERKQGLQRRASGAPTYASRLR